MKRRRGEDHEKGKTNKSHVSHQIRDGLITLTWIIFVWPTSDSIGMISWRGESVWLSNQMWSLNNDNNNKWYFPHDRCTDSHKKTPPHKIPCLHSQKPNITSESLITWPLDHGWGDDADDQPPPSPLPCHLWFRWGLRWQSSKQMCHKNAWNLKNVFRFLL